MKKLNLILIFLMASMMVAFAQTPKIEKAKTLLDKNEIPEAKSIIDAAIDYEKTKDKVKTWYYRGMIYEAIYTSEDQAVKNLSDDAFEQSVEAYLKVKAMENENSTYYIFSDQRLTNLYSVAFNSAAEAYQNEEYEEAIKGFEKVKLIYPNDTTAWMYTGYAANQINDIELALKNFNYLAENNMADENVHRNIIYTYRAVVKDTAKAIAAAERAREHFPESPELKQDEITLLIVSNNVEEAKDKILAAIENNPEDHILYYEMGYIYDASDEIDEAIKWYKKSLEKNPEYFDALYNLGVDYYNKGADILHGAQEMDLETYKKEGKKVEQQANEIFKEALPYFERAHEVNPEDVGTLQTLQTLYSLMKNYDKVNEVQEKLEALGVTNGVEGGE